MVTHPIHVTRDGYRGSNPSKRAKANEINRIASELEQYINGLLAVQEQPIQMYIYHQIAQATNIPLAIVRKLCMAIDGGSNGFTAIKPGLSYEQAKAAIKAV
ncbi:MAG: hypothetical protein Q7K57_17520 [Burkholderiaceae bacterium]|nr:hypothetical protein [Burkholderiaceae bacterium]